MPKYTHTRKEFLKKNYHESVAWQQNQRICGIDEVGRGCLAGPVVTAAVILPPNSSYRLLKDSKELTAAQREQAARWIQKNCFYAYGIVHHRIIDKYNIWHATLIAMKKAVLQLLATTPIQPSTIVIDAMPLRLDNTCYSHIPIHHFPFGEKKSSSIAAASILAKVKRDEMMLRMDAYFPHYIWHTNKGYSTKQHKQALALYHHTIMHRTTYIDHIDSIQGYHASDSHQQQTFL